MVYFSATTLPIQASAGLRGRSVTVRRLQPPSSYTNSLASPLPRARPPWEHRSVHRARRRDDSPWSDDTPAPAGREPADTLPIGTPAPVPHWTQVDTAHDGTPVMLRDAPLASGERSFLGADEPTEASSPRFDEAAPPTLPIGSQAPPAALPPTREIPSAPTRAPLSTALPPRPGAWSPRAPSERAPAPSPASLRATLLACLLAVAALAAVVFAYLVLAAPD